MPYLHLLFCSFLPLTFLQPATQPGSLPHTEVRLSDKMKNTQFSQTILKSFASPEQFIRAEFK